MRNRRVLQHVQRLKHGRLKALIDWSSINAGDIYCIAELYQQGDMSGAAEETYLRALLGKEKAWGAEHTSTLDTRRTLRQARAMLKAPSHGHVTAHFVPLPRIAVRLQAEQHSE